jgi:hypothetical protein
MGKFIITEKQLKKILETTAGSNSVAMDLDIYTQPTNYDTNNGNLDEEEAVQDVIDKLQELLSMFKSGKKVNSDQRNKIFKNLDDINSNFENIKYKN